MRHRGGSGGVRMSRFVTHILPALLECDTLNRQPLIDTFSIISTFHDLQISYKDVSDCHN